MNLQNILSGGFFENTGNDLQSELDLLKEQEKRALEEGSPTDAIRQAIEAKEAELASLGANQETTEGNLDQAQLAGSLGLGAMGTMNMSQDRPDVGTGMLSGAGMGLLNAGPLGAILGAGVGGVQSALKTAHHDNALEEQNRNMYENATVQPRSFELGGAIEPMLGAEYTPIQAEKSDAGKEVLVLPSLDIVDSGAEKSHDEMEEDDITDVVPESTYVFSSSDDMELDLKAVADTIVGLGISSYTEDGDNYGGHFIKFQDIFGDEGELTFSEAANKVKNKYKTVGNNTEDIFTKATNEDNKSSRMPIIQELIMMQEEMRQEDIEVTEAEESMIPQFKGGGYVKKYQLGGMTYDPPTFKKGQGPTHAAAELGVTNEAFLKANPQLEAQGYNLDWDNLTGLVYPGQEYNVPVGTVNVPNEGIDQFLPAASSSTPEGGSRGGGIQDLLRMIPGAAEANSAVTNALNIFPSMLESEYQTPGQNESDSGGDDMFDRYRSIYDELEKNNLTARDEGVEGYDDFFGRERGRNYLSTALQTATQFGQSTDVDVPEANTSYIDYMFPKMSRTEVEQAKSPLRQQVAQTAASLEQSGLPAGQSASVLAALQGQVLSEESKIEQNALQYNREQDAKKFAAFKQTADTNNAAFVDGQNRERELQRQQLAGGTRALQKGMNTAGILDSNELATQRQIQKSYNDNRMNLMMSEQELLGMQTRLESVKTEYENLMSQVEDSYGSKKKVNDKIGGANNKEMTWEDWERKKKLEQASSPNNQGQRDFDLRRSNNKDNQIPQVRQQEVSAGNQGPKPGEGVSVEEDIRQQQKKLPKEKVEEVPSGDNLTAKEPSTPERSEKDTRKIKAQSSVGDDKISKNLEVYKDYTKLNSVEKRLKGDSSGKRLHEIIPKDVYNSFEFVKEAAAINSLYTPQVQGKFSNEELMEIFKSSEEPKWAMINLQPTDGYSTSFYERLLEEFPDTEVTEWVDSKNSSSGVRKNNNKNTKPSKTVKSEEAQVAPRKNKPRSNKKESSVQKKRKVQEAVNLLEPLSVDEVKQLRESRRNMPNAVLSEDVLKQVQERKERARNISMSKTNKKVKAKKGSNTLKPSEHNETTITVDGKEYKPWSSFSGVTDYGSFNEELNEEVEMRLEEGLFDIEDAAFRHKQSWYNKDGSVKVDALVDHIDEIKEDDVMYGEVINNIFLTDDEAYEALKDKIPVDDLMLYASESVTDGVVYENLENFDLNILRSIIDNPESYAVYMPVGSDEEVKSALSPKTIKKAKKLYKEKRSIEDFLPEDYKDVGESFIEDNIDKVDWQRVSLDDLSEEFIERNKNKIDWGTVIPGTKSEEYFKALDPNNIKYSQVSEKVLRENIKHINWENLSETKELSEEFINDFARKLDWDNLRYEDISLDAVKKNKRRVNWERFNKQNSFRTIPNEYIKEFGDKLDFSKVRPPEDIDVDLFENVVVKDLVPKNLSKIESDPKAWEEARTVANKRKARQGMGFMFGLNENIMKTEAFSDLYKAYGLLASHTEADYKHLDLLNNEDQWEGYSDFMVNNQEGFSHRFMPVPAWEAFKSGEEEPPIGSFKWELTSAGIDWPSLVDRKDEFGERFYTALKYRNMVRNNYLGNSSKEHKTKKMMELYNLKSEKELEELLELIDERAK